MYSEDYEIGFASRHFVSMQWDLSEYCHGAAHGRDWFEGSNVVLEASPRALTAADIFGAGSHWKVKLQALFWDALMATDWEPGDQLQALKAQIMATVIRPEKWFFTDEGLRVSFGAYEIGCYACAPPPLTVKWEALKPLLAPDAVVP